MRNLKTNPRRGTSAETIDTDFAEAPQRLRSAGREFAPSAPEEAVRPSDQDSLRAYMQRISRVPLLTPAEEVQLAKKIQRGDKRARNHMIQANLRLVVKIAHDYKDFGLPLADLVSEGNIGLIKAVERFDPTKGGKLSTYAAWWIKQSIKRALANQAKTIRLPVHLVDKIAKMRRTAAQLADELGREPSNDELAEILEMPVNKVAHLKNVSVRPASMDATIGEDDGGATFGDLIGDERAASPSDTLRDKNTQSNLEQMVESLNAREAKIIRLRFGLEGERALTLEEVGKMFNLTRERVRQLQNLALSRMRKSMAAVEAQRSVEDIENEKQAERRNEVIREFIASRAKSAGTRN